MKFVADKVVNTVPAGMYRTGMYTGIETSTFRTGLNTGRIGHVPANFGQYRPIPANTEKVFFFFFF